MFLYEQKHQQKWWHQMMERENKCALSNGDKVKKLHQILVYLQSVKLLVLNSRCVLYKSEIYIFIYKSRKRKLKSLECVYFNSSFNNIFSFSINSFIFPQISYLVLHLLRYLYNWIFCPIRIAYFISLRNPTHLTRFRSAKFAECYFHN